MVQASAIPVQVADPVAVSSPGTTWGTPGRRAVVPPHGGRLMSRSYCASCSPTRTRRPSTASPRSCALGHEGRPTPRPASRPRRYRRERSGPLRWTRLHRDDDHALGLIEEISAYADGPVDRAARLPEPRVHRARPRAASTRSRIPSRAPIVQGAIEVATRRHAEAERLSEKVDQLESALDAPRGHRARQGHPHGAPRDRRPRGLRAPASPRRRKNQKVVTSRARWPRATRCCPRADRPLAPPGRGTLAVRRPPNARRVKTMIGILIVVLVAALVYALLAALPGPPSSPSSAPSSSCSRASPRADSGSAAGSAAAAPHHDRPVLEQRLLRGRRRPRRRFAQGQLLGVAAQGRARRGRSRRARGAVRASAPRGPRAGRPRAREPLVQRRAVGGGERAVTGSAARSR